ncbi:hypothetical protein CHARACLAT_021017 [Characodon lateralis]|uniref:Uncharacterized protein n=1 Tax=Characodon lateralis TaxID=208331 RepID=A0ABU7F4S2_9TELE|nr:hypothetical protein [Characodon lateralis]
MAVSRDAARYPPKPSGSTTLSKSPARAQHQLLELKHREKHHNTLIRFQIRFQNQLQNQLNFFGECNELVQLRNEFLSLIMTQSPVLILAQIHLPHTEPSGVQNRTLIFLPRVQKPSR